jgi:hypothetical protein
MKYWAYLVGKLVLAAGLLYPFWILIQRSFSLARPFDLAHYLTMFAFGLIAVGIAWLIVWDTRYRCRTCLRRLRMPIQRGSWNHVLLGAPHTEYICPYGHGTLSVAELQITGRQMPDWEPHEDMWKELFSLEETKK